MALRSNKVIGEISDIDLSLINATASTTKIVETSYCYDRENKNLLVTYTADGEITKYVYGNGLISSYKAKNTTTEYRNYTYDLRGSVTKTFDAAGKVIAEYTYSTYGDRKTIKGDKNESIGYCGREGVLTEANGLIYMRARYYSVELMRFINEDIVLGDIGNSNSLNRYTYVEGNPATMIDPFGLEAGRTKEGVSKTFKGLVTALKGGIGLTLEAGAIGLTEGVACVVLAGAMAASASEFIYGIADFIEGAQDIIYGIWGSDEESFNFIRDTVFKDDKEAYLKADKFTTVLGDATGIGAGIYDALNIYAVSSAGVQSIPSIINSDNQDYVAPNGGGGITETILKNGIEVTIGHGGRHLVGTGLNVNDVNQILAEEVSALGLKTGEFYKGLVVVENVIIEYTAYGVSDTVTNIGTYYPK